MLFCLDFDQTIVKGHFHNALSKKNCPYGDPNNIKVIQSLLNSNTTGLKNKIETKNFIQLSLSNGHKVAVTTYSLYPEVVNPTLKHMGLSDSEINQVEIIAFLPKDQSIGKTGHIKKAMETFQISDKSIVYLIDDSDNNCNVAINEGKFYYNILIYIHIL
jgi:hypothetical protein